MTLVWRNDGGAWPGHTLPASSRALNIDHKRQTEWPPPAQREVKGLPPRPVLSLGTWLLVLPGPPAPSVTFAKPRVGEIMAKASGHPDVALSPVSRRALCAWQTPLPNPSPHRQRRTPDLNLVPWGDPAITYQQAKGWAAVPASTTEQLVFCLTMCRGGRGSALEGSRPLCQGDPWWDESGRKRDPGGLA